MTIELNDIEKSYLEMLLDFKLMEREDMEEDEIVTIEAIQSKLKS